MTETYHDQYADKLAQMDEYNEAKAVAGDTEPRVVEIKAWLKQKCSGNAKRATKRTKASHTMKKPTLGIGKWLVYGFVQTVRTQ